MEDSLRVDATQDVLSTSGDAVPVKTNKQKAQTHQKPVQK